MSFYDLSYFRELRSIKKLLTETSSKLTPPLFVGSPPQHSVQKKRLISVNERSRLPPHYTPLMLAVARDDKEMLQLLLLFPELEVNAVDLESGMTALGLCLYKGNLELAVLLLRDPRVDVSVPDYDGHSPADLVCWSLQGRTLKLTEYQRASEELFGNVEIYTWGSNKNYVLCQDHADDRALPDRVDLSGMKGCPEQVIMSKYHTAILLNTGVLYLAGYGKGGRLGFGDEKTVMKPKELVMEDNEKKREKIRHVALGVDHTIIITEEGAVYTFGSNEFGQLGYKLSEQEQFQKKGEATHQLVPKRVNALKKEIALGAFGTKVHSMVHTARSGVYFWGKNKGQMGIFTSTDTIESLPKKSSFVPSEDIEQVAGTEVATAMLLKSKEVFLLHDFKVKRVNLPCSTLGLYFSPKQGKTKTLVSQVVSSKTRLGFVTTIGEAFVWNTEHFDEPFYQRVSARVGKRCIAFTSIAVGNDNDILGLANDGKVYVGGISKRQQRKSYSRASSSASLGDDKLFYELTQQKLLSDIASVKTFNGASAVLRREKHINLPMPPVRSIKADFERLITEFTAPDEEGAILLDFRSSFLGDVVFDLSGICLYAHMVILASRSDIFRTLLAGDDVELEGFVICSSRDGTLKLSSSIFNEKIVRTMLYCFYQDAHIAYDDFEAEEKLQLRRLGQLFHIDSAKKMYSSTLHFENTLSEAFASFFASDSNTRRLLLNAELKLANNENVKSSCVVLAARSNFFRAVFLHRMLEANRPVSLTHIGKDSMDMVLRYLYSDTVQLSEIINDNSVEFIERMLSIADELLLENLKQECEILLIKLIDWRTSLLKLVDIADTYQAFDLKEALIAYSLLNFACLAENKILLSLPEWFIQQLQTKLQAEQNLAFPVTRKERKTARKLSQIKRETSSLLQLSTSVKSSNSQLDHDSPLLAPSTSSSSMPFGSPSSRRPSMSTRDNSRSHLSSPKALTPSPRFDPSPTEDMMFQLDEDQPAVQLPPPAIPKTRDEERLTLVNNFSKSWEKPVILTKPSFENLMKEQRHKNDTQPTAGGTPKQKLKKVSQKERKFAQKQSETEIASAPAWSNVAALSKIKKSPTLKPLSSPIVPISETVFPESKSPSLWSRKSLDNGASPWKNLSTSPNVLAAESYPPKPEVFKSLIDIQNQQRQEAQAIKKKKERKKSIVQIQIEEKAMKEILEYYNSNADLLSGETFTVKTVTR